MPGADRPAGAFIPLYFGAIAVSPRATATHFEQAPALLVTSVAPFQHELISFIIVMAFAFIVDFFAVREVGAILAIVVWELVVSQEIYNGGYKIDHVRWAAWQSHQVTQSWNYLINAYCAGWSRRCRCQPAIPGA